MPVVAQIKAAWEHRALILAFVLVFLAALCKRQAETIAALKHAAPPPETVETRIVTVHDGGPVHITKHYAPPPMSCPPDTPPQLVTVDYDRGPSTTTTTSDTATKITPAAAAPASRQPWRYVGVTLDPLSLGQPRALGAGVAFWNAEAGLNYDWKYHALGLDARVRF